MRLASLSVMALTLGLLVSTGSVVRAEDVVATGTVSGKVVDGDGKAVAGADVKVVTHVEKNAGGKKGKGLAEDGALKKKADKPKDPGLTAKSDADGAFKIANVPAGTYDVLAKTADGAMGKSAVEVIVKGGDTVDAGTITVKAKAPKAPKNK